VTCVGAFTVDKPRHWINNAYMGAKATTLDIPDRRSSGRHLRVSWHGSHRVVVFSHWRDGVCIATTPVEVSDVPSIIRALVSALESASGDHPAAGADPSIASVGRDLKQIMGTWVRPRVASVVAFAPRPKHRND
jgi:hypothetical protein